jgi:hypothetical protein
LLLKRDECADAGPLSAKLLKNGTLKTYKGFPHGMPTTQADTINADLLCTLSVRRAEMQCVSGSANSYRAGIAMSWEPSQGSAVEMLESVSTDSRHYPQVRGARFAEDGGRFTGMPRMTLRLRYLTLKLRALCWVLRRVRAGRLERPE